MKKRPEKKLSGCPIDYGLDVFGDRWTLLVIRDLMLRGMRRFGELMQSPEKIASNVLAARLKKLEERGLISRAIDPDNRKQVIYLPTDKGRDLAPILVELIRWSGKHDPQSPVPKRFLERAGPDNDTLINEMRAAMAEGVKLIAKRRNLEK